MRIHVFSHDSGPWSSTTFEVFDSVCRVVGNFRAARSLRSESGFPWYISSIRFSLVLLYIQAFLIRRYIKTLPPKWCPLSYHSIMGRVLLVPGRTGLMHTRLMRIGQMEEEIRGWLANKEKKTLRWFKRLLFPKLFKHCHHQTPSLANSTLLRLKDRYHKLMNHSCHLHSLRWHIWVLHIIIIIRRPIREETEVWRWNKSKANGAISPRSRTAKCWINTIRLKLHTDDLYTDQTFEPIEHLM